MLFNCYIILLENITNFEQQGYFLALILSDWFRLFVKMILLWVDVVTLHNICIKYL